MPKKLTIFGVLMALVVGALTVFQGSAKAAGPPVQGFSPTIVNAGTCYDDGSGLGKQPVLSAGHIVCGANTSATHVALGTGTGVKSFTFIELPVGQRQTLPVTFTPSGPGQFGVDPSKVPCTPVGAGDKRCSELQSIGTVTAQIDLFCHPPAFDVLADSFVGTPSGWPDDPTDGNGWNGYAFKRTEDATVTGIPSDDPGAAPADAPFVQNAYVNSTNPFPTSFPFVSLDTSVLNKIFLGNGLTNAIPNTPLQLYTATSAYMPGLNVSVALLGGAPGNPPQNDYLCLDSPQSSETDISYVVPPTSSGLWPRWVDFTSAADFVNGDISRILVLQCVGVGATTSGPGLTDVGIPGGGTDGDDDCLATTPGPTAITDNNDSCVPSCAATADQDGDGVPDGVEAFSGSKFAPGTCPGGGLIPTSDCDQDGATDYDELFQFTNPNNPDTDGDGSLDKQDNGADETPGSPTVLDDTIADDNCPDIANPDQLNSDSTQAYHGGYTSLNNINPGPGPGNTQIAFGPVSITVAGATATVNTTTPHGFLVNTSVEIAGVTGVVAGSPAQSNSMRAINGIRQVKTPAGSTFTFTVPTVVPAVPAGTATGTIVIRPATGDATNPNKDILGDACDTDDDNDGIGDVAEPLLTIIPYAGSGSTVCKGPGVGAPPAIPLNPLNGDSDKDMVLDGVECSQGSRPDVASSVIAPCTANPAGCAQPKPATGSEDPDNDKLYVSAGGANLNANIENFYHTGNINQPSPAPQVTDIDGDNKAGTADSDSDADWNMPTTGGGYPAPCAPACSSLPLLFDGIEVRFYGTSPANADTDADGCDDARAVMDVNGDRQVSSGDQGIEANKVLTLPNLDDGLHGDPVAGDGEVNPAGINFDVNKDKLISSGDQAQLAFVVAHGGACETAAAVGKTANAQFRLPF